MAATATTFKKVTRIRRGEQVVILGQIHTVEARWPELATGAMFLKARPVKKGAHAREYKFPAGARVMVA